MKTIEYRTIDKSGWGSGPWQTECDKRQWMDEATGLPCLIVRNEVLGFLCGYVGVARGHPLFEASYDDDGARDLEVHGGLTFADKCQPARAEDHGICHAVEPGEDDDVWWLGFDSGHALDLVPNTSSGYKFEIGDRATYRDFAYVADQCAKLAQQLAAMK